MIFHDERLEQLTKMFLDTLNFISENPSAQSQTSQQRTRDLAEVIENCLNDQREVYIHTLLERLDDAEERLKEYEKGSATEHQEELKKMKAFYEEQLAKANNKVKQVQMDVKRLIEGRMKDLEKDYILKVVHEQEIQKANRKECDQCFDIQQIKAEFRRMEVQNGQLRRQIQILKKSNSNQEILLATELKFGYRSSSTAKLSGQQLEHYKDLETPPRKKAPMNKRASNTGGFQRLDSPNLFSQLQSIRLNLKEKHHRLMKTQFDDKKGNNLKRNMSTNHFKIENHQQSTQQNAQSSRDQKDIGIGNQVPKDKSEFFRKIAKEKSSPNQNPPSLNLKDIQNQRSLFQKEQLYNFKYLNLKM